MVSNRRFAQWRTNFLRIFACKKIPPQEFICPISNSLMFDPTIVASGQTFEHCCVDVCRDLSFTPTLSDGSTPDFSKAIPNLTLKAAIENWCARSGRERPKPPVGSDVVTIVQSLELKDKRSSKIRDSERELLGGVSEKPRILLSYATSELNRKKTFDGSGSDEESESEASVIVQQTPPFPFATLPSCLSSSSSPSVISEFFSDDASKNYFSAASFNNASPNYFSAASSISFSEDENFVTPMNSVDVFEQEQAVIQLRRTTRTDEDSRIYLCTNRILAALKQLLSSRYAGLQSNAAAAAVNLSLEKCNKIRMVRAGIVPPLIEILKNGFEESREHAAGAIFSLAIEDDNKTAIGVLGALPPLLHLLRSGNAGSRRDAALALYHLTLAQSNRTKIAKLSAAPILLGLLNDREVAEVVLLIICNLAACGDGREALLDAGAVHILVSLLKDRSESFSEAARENCVAGLYSLSHGNTRFSAQARGAGAVEVLLRVVETGSERSMEKARRILAGLRRRQTEEGGEVDWEAVMRDGVGVAQTRYRVGRRGHRNSSEF